MATAHGVDVAAVGQVTRFELQLDKAIDFKVFALADPYRIIIDMPETLFELPPQAGSRAEGLIREFRFGLFSPGQSRIVIDTTGPVAIDNPEIYEAAGNQPARLVVSFESTTREIFLRDFALNGVSRQGAAVPTPQNNTPAPFEQVENERPVVVVDPGHGGVDPGAISRKGIREKDIVLEFSTALVDELRATGLFEVRMTRSTDRFIKLDDRRRFARAQNADLFLSIHADSIRGARVRGATVYTVSEKASDAEAAAIAANENKADLIAGVALEDVPDVVTDILFDLARRETKRDSKDYAKELVKSMRGAIRLNRNPIRSAGFVVLKAPDVPSVLLELGYLSNSEDAKEMQSEGWRLKAVESVVAATTAFFEVRFALR